MLNLYICYQYRFSSCAPTLQYSTHFSDCKSTKFQSIIKRYCNLILLKIWACPSVVHFVSSKDQTPFTPSGRAIHSYSSCQRFAQRLFRGNRFYPSRRRERILKTQYQSRKQNLIRLKQPIEQI